VIAAKITLANPPILVATKAKEPFDLVFEVPVVEEEGFAPPAALALAPPVAAGAAVVDAGLFVGVGRPVYNA